MQCLGEGAPFTSYIELVNLSFLYFNNPVLLNITKTCFSILTFSLSPFLNSIWLSFQLLHSVILFFPL